MNNLSLNQKYHLVTILTERVPELPQDIARVYADEITDEKYRYILALDFSGNTTAIINLIQHLLPRRVGAYCRKCGDNILGDEDSLCGNCV